MDTKKFLKISDKKLAKQGADYVLIVPRKLIRYEVINPKRRFNIYFEELPEEVKEEK